MGGVLPSSPGGGPTAPLAGNQLPPCLGWEASPPSAMPIIWMHFDDVIAKEAAMKKVCGGG